MRHDLEAVTLDELSNGDRILISAGDDEDRWHCVSSVTDFEYGDQEVFLDTGETVTVDRDTIVIRFKAKEAK